MILFMYAERLAIDWRLAEHSHQVPSASKGLAMEN